MITPNYDIYRIDGPVVEDVIVTVGTDTQRESITLLEGQYVTVIVLTNREAKLTSAIDTMLSAQEKWFNP